MQDILSTPGGVYLVDIGEDELAATLQNVEEALVDDHPDVFVIELIERATCNDQTDIIERFVAQCSDDVTLYDLVGDFCRGKMVCRKLQSISVQIIYVDAFFTAFVAAQCILDIDASTTGNGKDIIIFDMRTDQF